MKRIIFLICGLVLGFSMEAQDRAAMKNYESQLNALFERVVSAPTDNERYNANEEVVQLMGEALEMDDSFKWNWSFGNHVSVLTSPDKKFRIFTWHVVNDMGEYECFGYVQAYDEKEENYISYVLNDKSDEIVNVEESLLSPDRWLGAVYQQIIQTSFEGKNYYTLLGWTGCNPLMQRKVIEPVMFKNGSSQPQFGQALFRREKNLRRIVLQYSTKAMVNLDYSKQVIQQVTAKRVKKGSGKTARMVTVKELHDSPELMIIFDEVAPQIPGMDGLFQYYVPTGTELAYVFVNGRWELRDNAQGRVPDERLNKEFAPIEKPDPAYKTKN